MDKEEANLLENNPTADTLIAGINTGKEKIQHIKLDTIAGTNTGEEYIQHIKADIIAGINTGREIIQHKEPDRVKSLDGNILTNEITLRGQAVKGTREQNITNSIENNARINRVQDIVHDKSCIRLYLTMNGVKVKAVPYL